MFFNHGQRFARPGSEFAHDLTESVQDVFSPGRHLLFLIQNVSGATFTPNKQHFTDVSVEPHADLRIDPTLSGNLPQIHALLSGSPAIDRIPLDACLVKGISTDQRGVKRPDGQERSCDIGAYEYVDEPA